MTLIKPAVFTLAKTAQDIRYDGLEQLDEKQVRAALIKVVVFRSRFREANSETLCCSTAGDHCLKTEHAIIGGKAHRVVAPLSNALSKDYLDFIVNLPLRVPVQEENYQSDTVIGKGIFILDLGVISEADLQPKHQLTDLDKMDSDNPGNFFNANQSTS